MKSSVFLLILAIASMAETCRHSGRKVSAMEEDKEIPENAKTVDQQRTGKKDSFYWYHKGKSHRSNFEKPLLNVTVPEVSTKSQSSALIHRLRAPRSMNANPGNAKFTSFFPKYCNTKLFDWCKLAPSSSYL